MAFLRWSVGTMRNDEKRAGGQQHRGHGPAPLWLVCPLQEWPMPAMARLFEPPVAYFSKAGMSRTAWKKGGGCLFP